MRVLHIIVGLEVGGAETMLKRMLEADSDSTSNTAVVSLTTIGVIGEILRARGVRVHALGMASVFDFPAAFLRLICLIRQYRPAIVQTWMYHADLLGGLSARMAGNHHVIWGIRTTDIQGAGFSTTRLVRWLCAKLSGWLPQAIICAAEASRQSHIAVGYEAKKMVVIPNGFDFAGLKVTLHERQSLRKQFGINPDDVVVGSLGRFHTDKDQENFVRSAALLAPRYSQLRFLMVGRGLDWNNVHLKDWIDSTGFKNRFTLLGERMDVPQCLSAMDIFCLHSRTEGFPNVLAEAMSIGLPCVSTNVGDAAMLLANTGVVVPHGDSAALAQGVVQLLVLDCHARCTLGMRAKTRVEAEFSMVRARERYEKIYQQVLEKRMF